MSTYPSALVINDITRHIQDEVPDMLSLDDIVLSYETRAQVNYTLDMRRESVKSKGFK